jgi:hypothetical protein
MNWMRIHAELRGFASIRVAPRESASDNHNNGTEMAAASHLFHSESVVVLRKMILGPAKDEPPNQEFSDLLIKSQLGQTSIRRKCSVLPPVTTLTSSQVSLKKS